MAAPVNNAMTVICTADDFGIGLATSRGIVAAHLQGPVTCTSVMTTRPESFAASVELLPECPQLELGLHFVWSGSGNRPLVATAASGFVTKAGSFYDLAFLWGRVLTGRVQNRAVVDEMMAQTEAFERATGQRPAYVDGHHHAHELRPAAMALVELASAGHLPKLSRLSAEVGRSYGPPLKRRIARHWAKVARPLFTDADIKTNDHFVGMLSARELLADNPWRQQLESISAVPAGTVVEWVVHPGEPDESLRGVDGYIEGRALELNALIGGTRDAAWSDLRLVPKSAALSRV